MIAPLLYASMNSQPSSVLALKYSKKALMEVSIMHMLEEGILDSSEIYFLLPSDFASKALYCLQHIGIFYCDPRYMATHPYWESILVIFVDEGELEVSFGGQNFTACKNDIVLIDCRQEHSYQAREGLKFHFFHFTGGGSVEYVNLICQLNKGALIRDGQTVILNNIFSNLLCLAKAQSNTQSEHRISVYLQMILCELAENCSGVHSVANESIEKAIHYMEEHVDQQISLDELAESINLSKFYFNRYFKKHMGMTPHQYFINMRLQNAKRMLVTTHHSVEKVADLCGFDNPSNFIRLFKQRVGMTPTAFRKIPF